MPHDFRVLLLLRSLERGGAERQASLLARTLAEKGLDVVLATFYDGGALRAEIEGSGVRVLSLQKKSRWEVALFALRLFRAVRRERPDVLYSFLTVPNVVAVLMKPLLTRTRVVIGVRASNMDLRDYDWFARITDRVEAMLARWADVVIANSLSGKVHAEARGFPAGSITVVPNGIDTDLFTVDDKAGDKVRLEWGVADSDVLVGLVARFDPMKDHETFVRAAVHVLNEFPQARFVCVGGGSSSIRERVRTLAEQCGVDARFIWSDGRNDMPAVFNAVDIACLSSRYGEGFPNAIAEAMSCGTPCVATDVGDVAEILGDCGLVVPPGNASLLAEAILSLARMRKHERTALGGAARARVKERYGRQQLAASTVAAFFPNAGRHELRVYDR